MIKTTHSILLILSFFLTIFALLAFFPNQKKENQKPEKPEIVLIKGGTYTMGQDDGEGDEGPEHQVELSDFYMGKYEITVSEFRLFCEATNREMPAAPSWGWKDHHPIINTSWKDAIAYIEWLNGALEEQYRLPTEAEFEYVIRNGGQPGVYPWGKGMPVNENIADESWKKINPNNRIWSGYEDGYAFTAPVGSFKANALGVHDINGNIWEWCSDWYEEYSDQTVSNPQGGSAGKNKVGRGASYNADPWHSRSASRSFVEPTFKKPGFRIAKDN